MRHPPKARVGKEISDEEITCCGTFCFAPPRGRLWVGIAAKGGKAFEDHHWSDAGYGFHPVHHCRRAWILCGGGGRGRARPLQECDGAGCGSPVIFARSGGFALHATSYTDGNYNLVAGGNTGISTPPDLHGKEIAISRNTIIEYVTDEILAVNGLNEREVSKVVIPQIPVRLEMLQSGNLAAAVLPEPMASVAVASGSRYVTGSGELGINPGVIVFADSAINEKADSIRAMYRAYNKSVEYLNHVPRAEYIDLVMEKSGFPAPARDALELKPYRPAGLPAEKDVEEAVHWVKHKELAGDYRYDDLVSKLLVEGK